MGSGRRAGLITVDLEAHVAKYYADMQEAGKRLENLGKTGVAAGRSIATGMDEGAGGVRRLAGQANDSERALQRYAAGVLQTTEAVAGFIAAHAIATGTLTHYTSAAASSAGATEQMVNSYRAVRLVLSPTMFTAASIAAGILVEQTVRLVNARAKLIDQQALFAASHGLSFQSIDLLDATSRVSGANPATVRALFQGLQGEWKSNQAGVQDALNRLGVAGAVGDPAILGRIAAGLHSVADPAKQAEIAIELFGERGGEALTTLNGHFANSAEAVHEWGTVIDELSRTQIHQFRQDLLDLKEALTDFSGVKAWWESFKTGTEIVAAAAEDMSKRAIHALDQMISDYLPGMTTLRMALTILTPGFAAITGQYGPGKIPVPGLPTAPTGAGSRTELTILTQDIVAEMNAANLRNRGTLEGQRSLAASKEAEARAAFAQAQNPNLTPEERYAKALEAQSAQMVATAANRYVKTMEDSQKAAEDAAKAAEAAKNSIENYERSIRERGMTPIERIYAKRDDLGFSPNSEYGRRAAVAANAEAKRVLDEEQEKLDKENSRLYTRQSGTAAPREGITFSSDIQAINRQTDEILRSWSEGVIKALMDQAIPRQQVAAIGRERDELGEIGANRERRLQLEADYGRTRAHTYQEELQYQRQLNALEAEELQIRLRAAEQRLIEAGQDPVRQAQANLEIDRARLAVQEQILRAMGQEVELRARNPFADGSLRSGWDEFIRQAKVDAEQPGKILYDGLNSATDKLAENLANAITGGKTNWAESFKQIGRQMVQSQIKSVEDQLVGWIGGKFGLGGKTKPTLAAGDPGHVIVDNLPGAGSGGAPLQPGGGSFKLPSLFGTGSLGGPIFSLLGSGVGSAVSGAGKFLSSLFASPATESVTSSISFAGMYADGGYIPQGSYGIAGERGPEPVFGPATVMSNKSFGGDTHVHMAPMDFRGADIGVEARIRQIMPEVINHAVTTSLAAQYEKSRRLPRSRR